MLACRNRVCPVAGWTNVTCAEPLRAQYKARCDFLVPALKQSSRTRASLTVVETNDGRVRWSQWFRRTLRIAVSDVVVARERTLANRKFAFNRIFGEGKENLDVLTKETAHAQWVLFVR